MGIVRTSRQQRVALVGQYYLEPLSNDGRVWSQDLHRWLTLADPDWTFPQPSLGVILNRLEERGLAVGLWEQFDRVVRRPPRKYFQLTNDGLDAAIQALQELRADPDRPAWVPVPELHNGRTEPLHPDGFSLTPPDGKLVRTDSSGRKLRAVR